MPLEATAFSNVGLSLKVFFNNLSDRPAHHIHTFETKLSHQGLPHLQQSPNGRISSVQSSQSASNGDCTHHRFMVVMSNHSLYSNLLTAESIALPAAPFINSINFFGGLSPQGDIRLIHTDRTSD